MAETDVVLLAGQLKKLTKDELISIIINNNVSNVSSVSETTVKQISLFLNSRCDNANVSQISTECGSVAMNHEFKLLSEKSAWLQKENMLLTKMCTQMEERIGEQSYLISILKQAGSHGENVNKVTRIEADNKSSTETSSDRGNNRPPSNLSIQKSSEYRQVAVRSDNPVKSTNLQLRPQFSQPKFIRGTASTPTVPIGSLQETFAAVARRAYLYVGNVNPNTKKESIMNYIADKYPGANFDLETLPVNENALSKSFKLTIDFDMLDTFNNPEAWPAGIIIKKFFRPKRRV